MFVGQFAGAAGTLASVGATGLGIQKRLLADLGLGVPAIGWHRSRDRIAEYGCVLGMVASTMGRIAHEVDHAAEVRGRRAGGAVSGGKVGSSTMPHKRNPMICEGIVAEARMARGLVPTLMGAMESEHERDWAAVHIEWALVPEISILTGGAVAHTLRVIDGLLVYGDRMRRNLDLLFGLPLSESVMLHLGEALGRQVAHEVVYEASMLAFEQERPLAELLFGRLAGDSAFSPERIAAMLRPEGSTGLCGVFVDLVAV